MSGQFGRQNLGAGGRYGSSAAPAKKTISLEEWERQLASVRVKKEDLVRARGACSLPGALYKLDKSAAAPRISALSLDVKQGAKQFSQGKTVTVAGNALLLLTEEDESWAERWLLPDGTCRHCVCRTTSS